MTSGSGLSRATSGKSALALIGGNTSGLLLLTLVLVARIAVTYPVTSATADEARHIAAGVEAYQTGRFSIYYWSPALPRYAHGLLPYLAGARLNEGTVDATAGDVLVPSYWATLTLARLGTLAFVPVLLIYAYLWGARLYGRSAGLAAAALVSLSPDVIAHASLATVDVPSAATILASTYQFWRWSERPSLPAALSSAVAFAGAILCKSPALLQLAVILLLFLAIGAARRRGTRNSRERHAPRRLLLELGLFVTASLIVTSAAYRFTVGPLSARPHAAELLAEAVPASLASRVATMSLPMPAYLDGMLKIWSQAREGEPGFLLGEVRTTGWWYYFPVALSLKMTFPALLLLAAGLGVVLVDKRRRRRRRSVYLFLSLAVLVGVAMTSHVNIGVRHVLPAEVTMMVLASVVFAAPWRLIPLRALGVLGAALLSWHAIEGVIGHPHYLAYFNPIARGRELQFLGDSNLDWGQDVARLALDLARRDLPRVNVCALAAGTNTMKSLGVKRVHLVGVAEHPTGWIAASAYCLHGLSKKDFRWLAAHRPVARIGKSIFLYRVTGSGGDAATSAGP